LLLPGCPRPRSSYFRLPTIARMKGAYHHTQIFALLRWGGGVSWTVLSNLTWNINPPHLSFLCSLRWQAGTTVPSYSLRWSLVNFLPGLALILPIFASQVARATGISHQHLDKFYLLSNSWSYLTSSPKISPIVLFS
jgi:hypothetical protein